MEKSKFQELIDAATQFLAETDVVEYQKQRYVRIRAALAAIHARPTEEILQEAIKDDCFIRDATASRQSGFEEANNLVLDYFLDEERRYREMAEARSKGNRPKTYDALANAAALFHARLQDDDHLEKT
jgi:hypothetical protein